MGSGFKDWTAGDVLTAADVDGYLMRQTVMTFADSSARDTALSGVLDEGMFAYLEDTNAVTFYDGSAWVAYSLPATSFTPSWANLTVGNGTNTGHYSVHGGLLFVSFSLTFGSTTSISGSVSFTTPTSDQAAARAYGTTIYLDATGTDEFGNCSIASGSTNIALSVSNTGSVNSTTPFTWTTSDQLAGSIVIPVV